MQTLEAVEQGTRNQQQRETCWVEDASDRPRYSPFQLSQRLMAYWPRET